MIEEIAELLERSFPDKPAVARIYRDRASVNVYLVGLYAISRRRVAQCLAELRKVQSASLQKKDKAYERELESVLARNLNRMKLVVDVAGEMDRIVKRYSSTGEQIS